MTNSFWHGQRPVEPLCLYRAGFGTLLCLESMYRLPYITELFSSEGFHAPLLAVPAPPPALAVAIALTLVVTTACIALGFLTRTAIVVTAILWGYFYAIDGINERAVHSIVLVVMTILLFSPCQARLSVDAHRARARGGPSRREVCAFTTRLLQLEFAHIYFFSGIAKMMNPEWVNGTVTSRLFNSRWATELAQSLAGSVPDELLRLGGLGTILFEVTAGFLLFVPWAYPWIIGLGIAFHSTIQLLYHVGTLGLHFMWALLILFPEPDTVVRTLRRTQQLAGPRSATRERAAA